MPIGLIIALLLLGGGGGASIAAQSSLPGDTLYPVKVNFNEKIAGAVRLTEASKAAWDSHLAETRLDEVAKLVAENKLSSTTEAQLQVAFKEHADSAEKRLEDMKNSGDAATAATLAGEFEAGLKTRGEIISRLKADGAHKIEIDSEIEDVAKVRKDAEDQQKIDDKNESNGPQDSADGKIGAAENVIESVKNSIEKLDPTSTTTIAEAQAKLTIAENLLAQAKVKLDAKDYVAAFDLAQQALITAQEARITGEIRAELNIHDEDLNSKETEKDNESSSTEKDNESSSTENNRERNGKVELEGSVKLTP